MVVVGDGMAAHDDQHVEGSATRAAAQDSASDARLSDDIADRPTARRSGVCLITWASDSLGTSTPKSDTSQPRNRRRSPSIAIGQRMELARRRAERHHPAIGHAG